MLDCSGEQPVYFNRPSTPGISSNRSPAIIEIVDPSLLAKDKPVRACTQLERPGTCRADELELLGSAVRGRKADHEER